MVQNKRVDIKACYPLIYNYQLPASPVSLEFAE
jgi:hypothetical protein